MKTTTLLVAGLVLGAAAVASQAGELYTPTQYQDAGTALTRAQVRQSVVQPHRVGEASHNDVDLPGNGTIVGDHDAFGKTRASVRAETLAARSAGELEHNDVDLPNVARGSVLTRQAVRNEAIASRRLVTTAPGRNTIQY